MALLTLGVLTLSATAVSVEDLGVSDPDGARHLAETYAPIMMLKAQEAPCDQDGEPCGPMPVDGLVGNRELLLRQLGTAQSSTPRPGRMPATTIRFGERPRRCPGMARLRRALGGAPERPLQRPTPAGPELCSLSVCSCAFDAVSLAWDRRRSLVVGLVRASIVVGLLLLTIWVRRGAIRQLVRLVLYAWIPLVLFSMVIMVLFAFVAPITAFALTLLYGDAVAESSGYGPAERVVTDVALDGVLTS